MKMATYRFNRPSRSGFRQSLVVYLMLLLTCWASVAGAQSRRKPASQPVVEAQPMPIVTWQTTSYDFGQIKQGEKITTTFDFTNSGEVPLIISNVQTTCGCTATDWSRKPISPQETSKISVTFNSAGKMGRQNKIITVITNAEKAEEQLTLSGIVLPADTKLTDPK